jgi:hypothetical protein
MLHAISHYDTCAKNDFIGGKLPNGHGRLGQAFVGEVGRINQDDLKGRAELFAAFVQHLWPIS